MSAFHQISLLGLRNTTRYFKFIVTLLHEIFCCFNTECRTVSGLSSVQYALSTVDNTARYRKQITVTENHQQIVRKSRP